MNECFARVVARPGYSKLEAFRSATLCLFIRIASLFYIGPVRGLVPVVTECCVMTR